jgi:hypothetical protein
MSHSHFRITIPLLHRLPAGLMLPQCGQVHTFDDGLARDELGQNPGGPLDWVVTPLLSVAGECG